METRLRKHWKNTRTAVLAGRRSYVKRRNFLSCLKAPDACDPPSLWIIAAFLLWWVSEYHVIHFRYVTWCFRDSFDDCPEFKCKSRGVCHLIIPFLTLLRCPFGAAWPLAPPRAASRWCKGKEVTTSSWVCFRQRCLLVYSCKVLAEACNL